MRGVVVVATASTAVLAVPACAVGEPVATPSPAVSSSAPPSSVARCVSSVGALSGVAPDGTGAVVVVPFEETDVVGIRVGQNARVSVAAVPGSDFPARVVGVGPDAVNISGVTNYYVTVVLTDGDPRLRAGQTATVSIPASAQGGV